jgi:hypothetical protein
MNNDKKLCVEYCDPVVRDNRDVATREVEEYIEKEKEKNERKG